MLKNHQGKCCRPIVYCIFKMHLSVFLLSIIPGCVISTELNMTTPEGQWHLSRDHIQFQRANVCIDRDARGQPGM